MLTDFGLVAFLDEGRATSIVGTPEFMPPEVVSGTGHGTDADWWSLGVTLCAQLHAPQPSPIEAATVGDRGRLHVEAEAAASAAALRYRAWHAAASHATPPSPSQPLVHVTPRAPPAAS